MTTGRYRHLTEDLRVGDELELRGPVGGYFQWRSENGGPLLLIAGGSGVVPLMAMLRHRAATSSTVDTRLLLSARSLDDALYREELGTLAAGEGLAVHYTLRRRPPADWGGFARRIDAEMLSTVGPAPIRGPRIYVCGPSTFVERAADVLVQIGHRPLRSEPSGSAPRANLGSQRKRHGISATAWTYASEINPCVLGRFPARPIL